MLNGTIQETKNRRIRRIVLAGMAVAASLVMVSSAQARLIHVYTTGSPGQGNLNGNVGVSCYSYRGDRNVSVSWSYAGISPAYSGNQDVYMRARVFFYEGSSWHLYAVSGWQKGLGGQFGTPYFNSMGFGVTPYPGHLWKILLDYQWNIASTNHVLGTATDIATRDEFGGYGSAWPTSVGGTGEGACYIG